MTLTIVKDETGEEFEYQDVESFEFRQTPDNGFTVDVNGNPVYTRETPPKRVTLNEDAETVEVDA